MTEPVYDKAEQLEKIQGELIPGETIEAVYDLKGAQSGFLGITSHRMVIYDKQFLRKIKALVSIPYRQISSIGAEDSSGLLTGRGFFSSSRLIIATPHGEHDFEFRGAEKAHDAHRRILIHMVSQPTVNASEGMALGNAPGPAAPPAQPHQPPAQPAPPAQPPPPAPPAPTGDGWTR